jgi:hypothetical protein
MLHSFENLNYITCHGRLSFLTYGLTMQYNVNLVFNTTKMAKATNVSN